MDDWEPESAFTLPDPATIGPVDPEHFSFLFGVGQAAHGYRMPMDSPSNYSVRLEDEDPRIEAVFADSPELRKLIAHPTKERFVFNDAPMNRFALAVRDQCDGDMLLFSRFLMRSFAFIRIMKSPQIEQWKKIDHDNDGEKVWLVNQAVMDLAATMPLNREGYFNEGEFFAKVAELAERYDQEDAEKPGSSP